MAIEGLVAGVTVEKDGENGLRTTGLSLDPGRPEQVWLALGDGLFQERGGTGATLAFPGDGLLVSSAVPSTAYEKLPWHRSPALHLGLLASGIGVLVLAALVLPATALVRRMRGSARTRPRHGPRGRRPL